MIPIQLVVPYYSDAYVSFQQLGYHLKKSGWDVGWIGNPPHIPQVIEMIPIGGWGVCGARTHPNFPLFIEMIHAYYSMNVPKWRVAGGRMVKLRPA